MNWYEEKENLIKFIFKEHKTYTEIGRYYNVSSSAIKYWCKKLKIKLPKKNKKEPWNKGNNKYCNRHCLNCGKILNTNKKYCDNKCQQEYEYKIQIETYKKDNSIAKSNKWGAIPCWLRRYIFEKYNSKCCICGWSEVNPYSGTTPLEIDHINGDSNDNSEDNLRLICPNCHSLTKNYRGANRGHGRNITWIIKK